ncbi:hypothetical protein Tco_0040541 [Tanacetum coccineum]
MGYLVRAYYSISPTKYYKDDSCWSADLKSNTTEDVISIGSFMEVLVLNHYVIGTIVAWMGRKRTSRTVIGNGLLGPIGGSCGGKGGRRDSMAGRGGGWFAKPSIDSNEGRGGGGFVVLGGKSSRESKNACGEVGGVEKMSSTGCKFMVRGEECLKGCVGADGGEVNGGGEEFGVSKSFLGEILGVVIGESGGETFRDDGGAVWHSAVVMGDKKAELKGSIRNEKLDVLSGFIDQRGVAIMREGTATKVNQDESGATCDGNPTVISFVPLTTVGDLHMLINDIEAGKHDELLSEMTNDDCMETLDALEEDEEEEVENVYDETANLFTKIGGSSFTAAAG